MNTSVPERAQLGYKVRGLLPYDSQFFNDNDFETTQRTPLQAPVAQAILGTIALQHRTPRSSMRTTLKQPKMVPLLAPAAPAIILILKVQHVNQ